MEEVEYTCHYGAYKVYDESTGKELYINRTPIKSQDQLEINEIKKLVRSVEIKLLKEFSAKIEKNLKT